MSATEANLDPNRVEGARRRASSALRMERHHITQARLERSKARQLARTWGFSLSDLVTREPNADA